MKNRTTSKLLSYVLRHDPVALGLKMDAHGWVSVDALVAAVQEGSDTFNHETLDSEVRNNSKRRFEYNEDKTLIRACQGHSVPVDLGLPAMEPPDFLYHGTAVQNMESIFLSGIHRGSRHAVHLSTDKGTAKNVGGRHGRPVILTIRAGEMHRAGHVFSRSTNGVWLVKEVPTKFISASSTP